MIVTAHQPNYLPGLSVIEKVRRADACVWLDEAQFSREGWTNRNRMPDGSWLTVPIEDEHKLQPINRVRIIDDYRWRRAHRKTLRQQFGAATSPFWDEIDRPYRLLVGLTLSCLRIILDGSDTAWHFQSHLDGGRAINMVSEDLEELKPISERLARMVAELGGTTYLSGPSGLKYLDETPFLELGIRVDYFDWDGPNTCSAGHMVQRSFYRAAA